MRVRYGKPIKVRSLLGKQNIFLSAPSSSSGHYCFKSDDSFYKDSQLAENSLAKKWTITSGHKYFCFIELTETLSTQSRFLAYRGDGTANCSNTSVYCENTGTTYYSISQGNENNNKTHLNFYTNTQTTVGVYYGGCIDLTEIGLDTLTAQQFYNKYNKYFPLIATGEEITIDDKAGQIAYENLNDSVIRCKIAGGSSDIYYGYNNIFNCDTFSGNTIGGGTVSLNDEGVYTYTFGSTIASNAYTNMVLDSKCQLVQNHKYLFVLRIKAPHTGRFYTRGFQSYDVTTANTWQDFTCIKTGPSQSSSFYISPDNPLNHGYQQGESYQIVALIIDLTWWFGEGKEPTTVAEFRERFAKDYYGACLTPIKLTEKLINAEPLYGYNQLVQINTSGGAGGMSWNQMDGLVTLSGTPTGTYFNPFYAKQIYTGDVYFISVNVVSNSLNKSFQFGTLNSNVRLFGLTKGLTESIQTANSTINSSIGIADVTANSNLGEIKAYFHLINLTDWYGQGNEPTTVAEFRATFPNKYYPYSLKRLLNKYMINNLLN